MKNQKPWLKTKDVELTSRLLIGTEQYNTAEMIRDVTIAAGAELMIATVNPKDRSSGVAIVDVAKSFNDAQYNIIPVSTTSFVTKPEEAINVAKQMRDLFGISFCKLDIRNDPLHRWSNNFDVIKAAEVLLNDGFDVMPMITPDPFAAKILEDMGCCALRLSAGELGTGIGLYNYKLCENVRSIVDIPCIGETGIISVAEVCKLFEIGMDAVLVNSIIAKANDPIMMAKAMRSAVNAAVQQAQAFSI